MGHPRCVYCGTITTSKCVICGVHVCAYYCGHQAGENGWVCRYPGRGLIGLYHQVAEAHGLDVPKGTHQKCVYCGFRTIHRCKVCGYAVCFGNNHAETIEDEQGAVQGIVCRDPGVGLRDLAGKIRKAHELFKKPETTGCDNPEHLLGPHYHCTYCDGSTHHKCEHCQAPICGEHGVWDEEPQGDAMWFFCKDGCSHENVSTKHHHCAYCDSVTLILCDSCNLPVCGEHRLHETIELGSTDMPKSHCLFPGKGLPRDLAEVVRKAHGLEDEPHEHSCIYCGKPTRIGAQQQQNAACVAFPSAVTTEGQTQWSTSARSQERDCIPHSAK